METKKTKEKLTSIQELRDTPVGFGFFLEYIQSQAGSAKLDSLESKVDKQTSRLDSLENKVDQQTSRLDSLEKKVDKQTSRLDSLESKVDKQTSRLDSLENKVDQQTSRLDSLESKVDKQTSRLDSLENKVDKQTSRLDSLENKVDKQTSRLDKLESGLDWLKWSLLAGLAAIGLCFIAVLFMIRDTKQDIVENRKLLIQLIQKQAFTNKTSQQDIKQSKESQAKR